MVPTYQNINFSVIVLKSMLYTSIFGLQTCYGRKTDKKLKFLPCHKLIFPFSLLKKLSFSKNKLNQKQILGEINEMIKI